jgi:2,4-dienoyl-CoA reductase-like NADH-dependent reductase (Old Yellow Enzyme family)/thioredoxin reductase
MHVGLLLLYSDIVPENVSILVPSMMPWLKKTSNPYHELSEKDIEGYIEDFGQAARRAREAGADAIELHACHGCLISSFLSPVTNRRADRYGGSVENRVRFARMILERIRQEVGEEFPVWVRINASDDVEGGITLDEAAQQAVILESAGADAVSVSGGLEYWSTLSIPCYPYPKGPMVPMAERIKKAVKVPVIAAGKIDAELAEEAVAEGKLDFVALGRPLLADPELPDKIRKGQVEDVRRCIYCNNCLKTDPEAGPGSCSVNPYLYREAKYPPVPAKEPKRVMVAGGGLGGMQVALFLAQRGHRVSLYEKSPDLGGQWNVACATPGKESYATFTDYLKRFLERYSVNVTLGAEITRDKVMEVRPDAVVVATGAVPVWLSVPGGEGSNVVQGHDVIEGKVDPVGKVVVVGGRFIGMEVAIWLAEQGREVSLVTRAGLGENGIRLEKLSFKTLARRLLDLQVPLYLNSTVMEITEKAVILSMKGEIYSLTADTVILSVGMQPENKLAKELEGIGPEVYAIGDCVRPRDAAEVAYQAARVAAQI